MFGNTPNVKDKTMTRKTVMARWKKKGPKKQRPFIFDCIIAKEIVYNAYKAGFIKWTVYDLAQDRIKRTMNGTWMFKELDPKK
jgi:hypothetical protein